VCEHAVLVMDKNGNFGYKCVAEIGQVVPIYPNREEVETCQTMLVCPVLAVLGFKRIEQVGDVDAFQGLGQRSTRRIKGRRL